jgi:hypothetical protein
VFDLRCKCNSALPSGLQGLGEPAGNCECCAL